jgi:tRNA(fMet)-specific endonuclease VapC
VALTVERLVLDTSAWSWMRRGLPAVLDAMAAAAVLVVPAPVIGELEAGFRCGDRYLENRRVLDDFLREPFVMCLHVVPSVARRYGELFARQRALGRPVPVTDLWIAACTLDCGGHLLTVDADFGRIPDLPHTLVPRPDA